jgi:Galactose oxidase-like, Early set domain
MRGGLGFGHRRARALAAGAVVAVTMIATSASAPRAVADPPPVVPFDANGYDDSFAIAQSRPQGPVIEGSTQKSSFAAVPALGDPVKGTFGAQVQWPIIPIHAVLLPDGRVLSYGTNGVPQQTGYYVYDIWDRQYGTALNTHLTPSNNTGTDIFCSSQIVLLNGDVEVYGGDNLPPDTNTQNQDVNLFSPADNTLVRTGSLNRLRWYSSATILPNAEVYIQGGTGGQDYPERRTSSGTFQLLTGAPTGNLSSGYPKNFVGPDGLVFGVAGNAMYRVNPAGNGSIASLGTFPTDNNGGTATSVMFAPGRILQVGGGNANAASRNASIIDINGASPQVSSLPQLQYGRHWGNATVMADGRVLVSGGSAVNNAATGVAYTSEIFNPATSSWSTGATAARMRLYHSVSLLLPDATVLTGGGGLPGPESNMNAEIYYPPYLFAGDGTPAVRPTITSATAAADPATTLSINTPDAATVARVSLVKMGSVTHSTDMDQRFLDLPFTRSGTTLSAALPANVNRTPPGHYMIFVLNGAGVPSEAKVVRIDVAGTNPPPTTTTTSSTTTSTTTTTMPPTTTSTTTSTTSTTSTTTSTSTTTTTSPPPPPPPVNLVVNGGFESNSVTGPSALVTNLQGWSNTAGGIRVWRVSGKAAEGSSYIEVDSTTGKDRIEQVVRTATGRTYTFSFQQSPALNTSSVTNRFDVFWNSTKLGTITRNGAGLTSPSWLPTTYTVTGTGNDRISFRENDRDAVGGLIDDVRVVAN